jgi:hypothetical protein
MEDELEAADFVIVVCSARYYERYRNRGDPRAGRGGRWESNLIRNQLYADLGRLRRYVPILADGVTVEHVPDPLRHSVTWYRLDDSGYDDLYRFLTAQHPDPLPVLGQVRPMPTSMRDRAEDMAGDEQRGLLSGYLRTLIDRLGSDRWPLDPRLGGPLLNLGKHQVDVVGKEDRGDRLVTATEATQFRRLVVRGGPGAGKTWFAARAAVNCAQRALVALEEGSEPHLVVIPLFSTLATVRDQPPNPIRERLVAATLTSFADAPSVALKTALTTHEHVLVVLDSLDEAPGSDELLTQLDAIQWSIMLTTRPSAWRNQIQLDDNCDDVGLVTLEPLSYPADVRDFVHAWFGNEGGASCKQLLDQLARAPHLQEAACVPLLLAFFCILGHDELVDDLDALLERTINRLLRGVWKPGRSETTLRLDRLHAVLRDWAWGATGFSAKSAGIPTWSEIFDAVPDECDITADESAALANVCPAVGPPDLDSTGQPRRFIHRVIQEHLVASVIAARAPSDAAAIVRAHLWASDEWRDVLPAVIRCHPERVELCTSLLEDSPFAELAPEDLPSVDFEGALDQVLLTLAASADPQEATAMLASHVHAARLRLLDSIEQTLHYGMAPLDIRDRAERSLQDLAHTTAWGIGADADLGALAVRLVPRTGSIVPSEADVPIKVLGLSERQRGKLREIFLDRMDEDDGSFRRVLTALVVSSTTESEQLDLLMRLKVAWDSAHGWRRDEIAVAYRTMPAASEDVLRELLIRAIDEDIAAGTEVSWGLVRLLSEIEGRHKNQTAAAVRFTSWVAATRSVPCSVHPLADTALKLPLIVEQRGTILDAITEAFRLSSTPEWLGDEDDDDDRAFDERYVAAALSRLLAVTVGNSEQAARATQVLARVVANTPDLRTVYAAAEAIEALEEKFPAEVAMAVDTVRTRLPRRYLSRAMRTRPETLSAQDATRGLLASGEGAGQRVIELGPHPPEYWAEVQAACVQAIDNITEASVERLWAAEAALHVAAALERQDESAEPITSAVVRLLTRVRDQKTNQWRLKSMCQLALDLVASNDKLAPEIYEVIAYRLSQQSDPTHQRMLVGILTDECRRAGRVPDAMVPVLDRLKTVNLETRQLICSRYEFLGRASADEQQEFLRLLSTHNPFLDGNAVSEISRLNWPEATQTLLWSCVLARLSSDDETWWHRTRITEVLIAWARTSEQRVELTDRLAELLSRFATDTFPLQDGRGIRELVFDKDVLPASGLDTNLGKFVRLIRRERLPGAVLRGAHDALVARTAAGATTLKERAALLECAGALLPDDEIRAADTRRALRLFSEAETRDDGLRSQRALLQFRPTTQDLTDVRTWAAPPTPDLLRVVRRAASGPDWYSLLQHLAGGGLLEIANQSQARGDANDQ